MVKTFCVVRNKDSAEGYIKALEVAGYKEAGCNLADIVLLDRGNYGNRYAQRLALVRRKPGFIYPHSPTAYFLWDRIQEPLPVKCNFVHGEGAKWAMRRYGYPHRVEACGFSRCEVAEFTPTAGTSLLFVPARPRSDNGVWQEKNIRAFKFILDHRELFQKIGICYTASLATIGFEQYSDIYKGMEINFILTNPKTSPHPTQEMIERIREADLVISCTTVSALSVAMGKPTIQYGEDDVLTDGGGHMAKNYHLYRDIYEFPLQLERMDIDDVLAVREEKNAAVERWKTLNLGGKFMPERFISVIEEY